MFKLDELKGALRVASAVSELEMDENFHQVVSFMENGEFDSAIPLIENTFQKKVLDIRFILYFLYAYFVKEGAKSLVDILPLLHVLIEKHWENLSPSKNREKQAEKSLNWFFARQVKTVEGVKRAYKNKDFEPLKKLTEGVAPASLDKIQEWTTTLSSSFSSKWPNGQVYNQLMHMVKSIRELSQMALSHAENQKKETVAAPVKEEAPIQANASQTIPLNLIEPSPAMEALYKKMHAFKVLVERRDYHKAAVVIADVEQCLENFNPAVYFPKLFIDYYKLYAKHATQLEGSPQSNAHRQLQKLFEADIDAFVDW